MRGHQFGRMTYGLSNAVAFVVREEHEAALHTQPDSSRDKPEDGSWMPRRINLEAVSAATARAAGGRKPRY